MVRLPWKGIGQFLRSHHHSTDPTSTQYTGKVKTHNHTKPRRPLFTVALMPNSPKVPPAMLHSYRGNYLASATKRNDVLICAITWAKLNMLRESSQLWRATSCALTIYGGRKKAVDVDWKEIGGWAAAADRYAASLYDEETVLSSGSAVPQPYTCVYSMELVLHKWILCYVN